MKVYGQLENATAELLASDPASTVLGRIWFNTTTGRLMLGDGSVKQPLLRNDQKIVIGTNGTAASNVRFNRAAAGLLQLVTGDDATAEGSLSTAVAQLDSRVANFTTLARPAAASAGRIIYDTTLSSVLFDNGANYKLLTTNPMTAAGDILYSSDANGTPARLAKGSDAQLLTLASGVPSWANAPATPLNYLSKTGNYTAVINDWVVASSGSFTITLPTAVSQAGSQIVIQHNGSLGQVYTINTTSAQTLNGPTGTVASGAYALYTPGETLTVRSDGANWQVVGHKTDYYQRVSGFTVSAASAYVFTVTSANATAGAIYSNNGFQYTVTTTIAASVTLTCSGTGTPAASGTLTKVSGTGDATITFSSKTTTGQPAKASSPDFDYVDVYRSGSRAKFVYRYSNTSTTGSAAGSGIYIFYLPPNYSIDTNVQPISILTPADSNPNTEANIPFFVFSARTTSGPTGGFAEYGIAYSATSFYIQANITTTGSQTVSSTIFSFSTVNAELISFEVPISGWQP